MKTWQATLPSACFILVQSFSIGAFAWGDKGHQIVGQIAEQMIKTSTKNYVRGILGVEPLALAATWPDHVRDDARFEPFDQFHYCEIPTGFDYKTNPKRNEKDCFGAITGAENFLINSSKSAREEKMIMLRYLVHVIGDIHQPFHVGNGYDRGANACIVKSYKYPNSTTLLHSFWDTALVDLLGESYADPKANPPKKAARYLRDYMTNIKERYKTWFNTQTKNKLGASSVESWLNEAQQLRESGIYPDNPADMVGIAADKLPMSRPYCDWYSDQEAGTKGPGSKVDYNKVPTLDEAYAKKYMPVIEEQIVKAGIRLATTLDRIADSATKKRSINNRQQDDILKEIVDAFKNHQH